MLIASGSSPAYLAANAIVLPISGWLAMRLGRRNYFLLSIAIFTLASALVRDGRKPGFYNRISSAARVWPAADYNPRARPYCWMRSHKRNRARR